MEQFYPESASERVMKIQEIILKAIGKEIKWIQAADILGVRPQTIRRMRARYLEYGVKGLVDRGTGRPSRRRVSYEI